MEKFSKSSFNLKQERWFKHDCDNCYYLGSLQYEKDEHGNRLPYGGCYDLYVCAQCGLMPTVIARYGDNGYDYISGLDFRNTFKPLAIAYHLAVTAGLLDIKGKKIE